MVLLIVDLLLQVVELVIFNLVLQDHYSLVRHDNYYREEMGSDKIELVDQILVSYGEVVSEEVCYSVRVGDGEIRIKVEIRCTVVVVS